LSSLSPGPLPPENKIKNPRYIESQKIKKLKEKNPKTVSKNRTFDGTTKSRRRRRVSGCSRICT
jgi:hypothetical protein